MKNKDRKSLKVLTQKKPDIPFYPFKLLKQQKKNHLKTKGISISRRLGISNQIDLRTFFKNHR